MMGSSNMNTDVCVFIVSGSFSIPSTMAVSPVIIITGHTLNHSQLWFSTVYKALCQTWCLFALPKPPAKGVLLPAQCRCVLLPGQVRVCVSGYDQGVRLRTGPCLCLSGPGPHAVSLCIHLMAYRSMLAWISLSWRWEMGAPLS